MALDDVLPGVPPRRRSRTLHWAAFAGSVVSLALLTVYVLDPAKPLDQNLVRLDVALSAAAAAEFFTRSGFRYQPWRYALSRSFDFAAMIPALALVGQSHSYEGVWVWLLFGARLARVLDRWLGDGFVQRHARLLFEAFMEEITDRVTIRLLNRVEATLHEGRFGQAVAEALRRNRADVLAKIRASHPHEHATYRLASKVAGLDEALAEAEARAYDAVIEVAGSHEVDRTLRDMVRESFQNMRDDIRRKEWKERLGWGVRR